MTNCCFDTVDISTTREIRTKKKRENISGKRNTFHLKETCLKFEIFSIFYFQGSWSGNLLFVRVDDVSNVSLVLNRIMRASHMTAGNQRKQTWIAWSTRWSSHTKSIFALIDYFRRMFGRHVILNIWLDSTTCDITLITIFRHYFWEMCNRAISIESKSMQSLSDRQFLLNQ